MLNQHLEALHLCAGWWGVTLGVLTGGLIGMFFHKEDWLGGYNTWPRRLVRLGHISFFGLAFLNFMFALTVEAWELCTLFDINYQPSQMSVEELEFGLRSLGKKIYAEEAIRERRRAFFERKRELARSSRQ